MKLYSPVILSFSITLAIFFAFQLSNAFAQTTLEVPQSADLLQVNMDPSVPKPFDHVTIDLVSFMTDLDKATISWSLGGTFIKKGLGEKHFEFSVGDVGETTTVNLSIQSFEGETISRKISVRPGNIDLIWEAFTYTPPFYKGKALYTAQADIKIVALPNILDSRGAVISSKSLIYRWKLNGKFLQADSGYGKDSLSLTGSSILRNTNIEVEASSIGGDTTAVGSISLTESSPLVFLYEDNPLLGIFYENAVPSEFNLAAKEVTLAAIPYFFSTVKKDSGISYSWLLNNSPLTENRNVITLRNDAGEKGVALIGLETKSVIKQFQFSKNSLLMHFGESSGILPSF